RIAELEPARVVAQRWIVVPVLLRLWIHRHGQRCWCDCETIPGKVDGVVRICRERPLGDRIRIARHVLPRCSYQSTCQCRCRRVAEFEPGCAVGQRWISTPVLL